MNTKIRFHLAALAMLLAVALTHPLQGQSLVPLAISHFDDTNKADGWLGTNSAHGAETLSYHSGGVSSNSIGYISVSETSGDGPTMYLAAPAKFLGDQHAAYNGFLRFQLKQSATTGLGSTAHFLVLGASNVLLTLAWGTVPPTNWTFFEVPLNENVGWFNYTSNRFATRNDFLAVLRGVTSLWIQGEYSSNAFDKTDLDDVELLGHLSGPTQPSLAIATYAGIKIDGEIGASYRVEYRDVLDGSTNWQSLADVVLPSSPYLFIDQTSPVATSRFYRAVLNP